MLRSRTAKLVFTTAALLALYVIGIILRQHYGILIAITNEKWRPAARNDRNREGFGAEKHTRDWKSPSWQANTSIRDGDD